MKPSSKISSLFVSFLSLFAAHTAPANPLLLLAGSPPAASAGPITFVGVTVTSHGGSTGPTVNYPSAVANDVWLLFWQTDSAHNSSGTPPTGWTKVGSDIDGSFESMSVFWKRATGSEGGSEAWTSIFDASETGVASVMVYRGCVTSGNPIEAFAVGTSSFGTAKDISTTSLTNAAMIVCVFGVDLTFSNTFTWGAGIDERLDSDTTPAGINSSTFEQLKVGDRILATAGAAAMGGDLANGANAQEFVCALTPQ